MEFDDLIGLNTFWFVGLLGIQPPESEIAFCPMNLVEACKVQISSVEDVNSSGFDGECPYSRDFFPLALLFQTVPTVLRRESFHL